MLVSFALGDANFSHHLTQNPQAGQWNIGCVGYQTCALAMYISCTLCRFHLRLAPNANPVSSGIWALGFNAVSTAMVISRREQGWELIQSLVIGSMR